MSAQGIFKVQGVACNDCQAALVPPLFRPCNMRLCYVRRPHLARHSLKWESRQRKQCEKRGATAMRLVDNNVFNGCWYSALRSKQSSSIIHACPQTSYQSYADIPWGQSYVLALFIRGKRRKEMNKSTEDPYIWFHVSDLERSDIHVLITNEYIFVLAAWKFDLEISSSTDKGLLPNAHFENAGIFFLFYIECKSRCSLSDAISWTLC